MRYRRLGATGLEVSEVGFGAWGIGGVEGGAVGYGPTDDRESTAALRRAFDLGVTFYDTADIYGNGHSEELIGAALHDVRSRIVIATKVGLLGPYGPQDFSPVHLRASLEASLRRLQTDYVDLYQLHNPPMALLAREPDILGTLEAMRREGKVRAIGVSVKSPDDGLPAVRACGVQAAQVNFSMIDQRSRANGLLALAEEVGAGLVARTPLCYGFLSGKYSTGTAFEPGDHRAAWSAEQLSVWAGAPRVFGEAIARTSGTPAQVALRFCLSYGAVAAAIPGMLTTLQVDENTAASRLGPLGEEERFAIEAIYAAHEFFMRPQR